ncbi:MarR family transcriptional regulator [Mycolicibacterium sp. BiH015]|uniref:MarR family winged helix-turn-helix transcriptional regulator n=1 Tax=Mycolicibacterium sp. BiH015 TaxID=3018808 RepID=UPI0022E713D8|nr:MarR family transcriptional regulator [Mycolicibacterium sp. BiH015]MDA2891528.1 MarR family transcriptional regulator [Mycolicibacterium sp. BiH015]
MTVATSVDSVSEVFFQAERRWTDVLGRGLLDAEVSSIDGWRVLGALRGGEGLTMSDISSAMSIPPPSLTRLVDKLVDNGLVLRRVDATDRRRVLIYLSARGKTKVRKLIRQEVLLREMLVEELGQEAAAQFLQALARLGALPQ